jgi:uncharacterized protein YcfJ
MKFIPIIGMIALFGSLVFITGCTKEEKTISGVAIGAGSGALIGSAAGGTTGGVVGGVTGGVLGGVIGHSLGDDK